MGLLNWIVGILAICTPTLEAKDKATEVSIAVLVGLLVLVGLFFFHRRNRLLGSNPGRGESSNAPKTSMLSRFKLDAREVINLLSRSLITNYSFFRYLNSSIVDWGGILCELCLEFCSNEIKWER